MRLSLSLSLSLLVVIIFNISLKAQFDPVNFKLEKLLLNTVLNFGIYKSRLSGASEKENSFKNISFFAQVYFPFKKITIVPKTLINLKVILFILKDCSLISPMAVFHFTERGKCSWNGTRNVI